MYTFSQGYNNIFEYPHVIGYMIFYWVGERMFLLNRFLLKSLKKMSTANYSIYIMPLRLEIGFVPNVKSCLTQMADWGIVGLRISRYPARS